MSSIVTVKEYSDVLNKTLTVTEIPVVENYLVYATELVEKYCDRDFAKSTHEEWYNQRYSNNRNIVWLESYPINKIYSIGIPQSIGTIQNSNVSAVISSVSYDSNVFSLNHTDIYGDDITIELLKTANKTLTTLKTNIEANNGWSMVVDTPYVNYPTKLLQPIDLVQTKNAKQVYMGVDNDTVAVVKIFNECGLELNQDVENVYVKYQSGYDVSVDNVDHTAIATQGNVPRDLIYAISYIVNDMLSYANGGILMENNGISSNMIKSETIGDYSYTKFDKYSVDEIILKYHPLIDRYQKKSFIE